MGARNMARELASETAVYDASRSGRLRMSGEDAIDLLDRLSTNALSDLRPGEGMATVLTTNKGRIIDLLRVLHRGDDLLILTSAGTQKRIAEWIDFYTFAEDAAVEDITERTAHRVVVGGGAADALCEAFPNIGGLQSQLSHAADGDSLIIRADMGERDADGRIEPLPAYEIITPLDAPAPPIPASRTLSEDDMKALRIALGIPSYPNELNEDRNPLEANLKPYINFNKGCYIGQEVVARLNTYGRVRRFLFLLDVDGEAPLEEDSSLTALELTDEMLELADKGLDHDTPEHYEAGFVTSSTPGAALAYLTKRFAESENDMLTGGLIEDPCGEYDYSATSVQACDIRPRAYFEDPGAVGRANF